MMWSHPTDRERAAARESARARDEARRRKVNRLTAFCLKAGLTADVVSALDDEGRNAISGLTDTRVGSEETWRLVIERLDVLEIAAAGREATSLRPRPARSTGQLI